MSFVLGYLVSMRYLLLGYVRRGLCLAGKIAYRDAAQLVLLSIGEPVKIRAERSAL